MRLSYGVVAVLALWLAFLMVLVSLIFSSERRLDYSRPVDNAWRTESRSDASDHQ
jgi:hypothetical protein